MAARSMGSGTITFGLVSIPMKVYPATRAQGVSFNMLHKDCGSRVKQQLICPAHEPPPVIERSDTVRAYEHARDQFVTFTDEELKALEAARPSELTLVEFVPADSVDLLYIERTYYLGPDKGGDNAYQTLANALANASRIGVGRFANRGKDNLVLLRPYRGGLILHEAYYANEVLPWEDVPRGNGIAGPQHVEMAELLIEQLERPTFEPERFRDEWADKVEALVAKKIAGEQFVAPPPALADAKVLDLLDALKKSVSANEEKISAVRTEVGPKGPKKAAPRKAASKKRRTIDAG